MILLDVFAESIKKHAVYEGHFSKCRCFTIERSPRRPFGGNPPRTSSNIRWVLKTPLEPLSVETLLGKNEGFQCNENVVMVVETTYMQEVVRHAGMGRDTTCMDGDASVYIHLLQSPFVYRYSSTSTYTSTPTSTSNCSSTSTSTFASTSISTKLLLLLLLQLLLVILLNFYF